MITPEVPNGQQRQPVEISDSCVLTEIHPEKLRTASWDCSTGRGVIRIMNCLPINSITAHIMHIFLHNISVVEAVTAHYSEI